MSQEIELKLVFDASQYRTIMQLCQQFAGDLKPDELQLANTYYDTDGLILRQYDMGLRVRQYNDGSQEYREQTVKLAGKVLGGLHSRPEYSVPAPEQGVRLRAFDSSIWPEEFPLEDIESELKPLFTTNFKRTRWHIQSGDGQIELVIDEGEVVCDDDGTVRRQSLFEVELEVQNGKVADVYKLARRLINRGKARIGTLSKAARGYLLAQKSILEPFTQSHFVPHEASETIADGLYQALNYGIRHWQHNDACLRQDPNIRSIAGIHDGMRLCRVVLDQLAAFHVDVDDIRSRLDDLIMELNWLNRYEGFSELIAEDGAYHIALKENPKLYELIIEEHEHAAQLEQVVEQSRREAYQLTLLELGELIALAPEPSEDMQTPLRQWAAQRLKNDWQQVIEPFSNNDTYRVEQYLKLLVPLQESLLLGYCVGYLFDADDREQFRAPWLDMARGIREITALKLLRETIKDSDETQPERLLKWQESQQESLLYALNASRKAALKQEPYWLI